MIASRFLRDVEFPAMIGGGMQQKIVSSSLPASQCVRDFMPIVCSSSIVGAARPSVKSAKCRCCGGDDESIIIAGVVVARCTSRFRRMNLEREEQYPEKYETTFMHDVQFRFLLKIRGKVIRTTSSFIRSSDSLNQHFRRRFRHF